MSDDNMREFKEQLNRIERCLIGDEGMGQVGLVKEHRSHAERLDRIERAGIYLAGGGGILALLWTIWSQWPR